MLIEIKCSEANLIFFHAELSLPIVSQQPEHKLALEPRIHVNIHLKIAYKISGSDKPVLNSSALPKNDHPRLNKIEPSPDNQAVDLI